MPYVGGVLNIEPLSACVEYLSIVGTVSGRSSLIRSSLIITIVSPEGHIFFCAPEYIMPNLLTSITSDIMQDDISEIRGSPFVSGRVVYFVP